MICEACEEGNIDVLCRQVVPYDYRYLFLDVDSCLCGIEGINELALMCGKKTEIVELTRKAMDGEVAFDEVFQRRLEIIRPMRRDLARISRLYIENLAPDAKETIQILQDLGVNVCLISGGYREAILPLAEYVGISERDVYANELFFRRGRYAGFDESNPLSRNGGKREVIEKLRAANKIWGPMAIMGDAVSELETKPVVDLYIGFGGFESREVVKEQADVFLPHSSFSPILPLIFNCQIWEILLYYPQYRKAMKRGLEVLRTAQFNYHAFRLGESLLACVKNLPQEIFEKSYPVPPVWKGY
ncbi:MAG: HAD-IB family phosphatase [Candidatus Spechtbacterales bacterium]